MQLKLKVGNEKFTIDVKPSDTFEDISERLCCLGNIKVDLNQLRSSNNDKPFHMSTNVIDYFTKSTKEQDIDNHNSTHEQLTYETVVCRLCGETLANSQHYLHENQSEDITIAEKINASLPIHVSSKDPHPKQVCDSCKTLLGKSYDFVRQVIEAQSVLESRLKPDELNNVAHKDCRCPLCNNGLLKSVCKKSCHAPNQKKVSTEKGITVQVPRLSSVKLEGENKRRLEEDVSSPEYYYDEEVVTGYWEPRGSSSTANANASDEYAVMPGTKKYKKRIKVEDDHDWTIDEEYIPVSRRGRPKGTKNKPKIVSIVERSCVLCDWAGADLDMLAHTINIHCQPDLGYFPCPMCRSRHDNELILESHIEEHIAMTRKNK